MKIYNIEGDINFFDELYKSLDIPENEHKCSDDDNRCLITNEILNDKFVEMECGHKFNYIALYKDLTNHKNKFNAMETSSGQLKINEIRCPYCRKKHIGLLPYYEDLNLDKVHGVNYIDENKNYIQYTTYKGTPYKQCEYLSVNINYDCNGNEQIEPSVNIYDNCKFIKCMLYGTKIHNLINHGDEKVYCYLHKKIILKKYKKDDADKTKEEKQQAKIKLKQSINEVKQKETEAKQKIKKIKSELKSLVKAHKINNKSNKNKSNAETSNENNNEYDENIVIGLMPTLNTTPIEEECIKILKRGINKGNKCRCKVYFGEYCKRHYKVIKNDNIISNEL